MDKQKALLFGSAAAIRLLLFTAFPSLSTTLGDRVELSTPVTSFKRLQEGLFLYNHNVSPYDGGVFHQAPLLLPLFSLLPDASSFPLPTNLLYILVDLLSACALYQIAETGQAVSSRLFTSPRKELRGNSLSVAAGYLFNPFTILTCLARPTSTFTHLTLLQSISHAAHGSSISLLLSLALASYLAIWPLFFLPPLMLLCYDVRIRRFAEKPSSQQAEKPPPSLLKFSVAGVMGLCIAIGILLGISYAIVGSWSFIPSILTAHLLLPDLTPNVGLWWYFFIEMFDSFRSFFLAVFWLHMFSYVPGLCIRLRKQPLFVCVALLGVVAVFAPYPAVGEAGLFLAGLGLYRHIWGVTRYTFLALSTLLYASSLGPAFYHLWISAGSGNANFFYAITLVWALGLIVILADAIFAVLRDEWEKERPEYRGKSVRQI
ncbi:PIG-U-domain-containing protein [Aulographum hederae CBS 113979]|uniref:PIG-U-domain-containing protein n=1 Tax=Aulographum hederae CBS 113979 TaxID=1176131 RepID=A0A6G1GNM4_9PEZI|nr:PIG-U-domain-containing protein [Aulographum hederae CBS 113979]